MSLHGSIQIGRSALVAGQAGLQIAGNNMANAATQGYHRRSLHLTPLSGDTIGNGQFVGRGVQILDIRREVDVALQSRLRDAISDEQKASVATRFLDSIESLQNELSDNDVSSLLSAFANSFSELANNPTDSALRSLVVEQARTLTGRISDLRTEYTRVIDEVDRDLKTSVDRVNDLLGEVAAINDQIARTEPGVGEANSLRDQRDVLLDELAQFVDITVLPRDNGMADVLVGSIPVLIAAESRGMELREETVDGELRVSLRVEEDGTFLDVTSGRLGGLMAQRGTLIEPTREALDAFAAALIFNTNKLHAQGQGAVNQTFAGGTTPVLDSTVNLNNAASGVPFPIENGSFFIHVTHAETGTRTAHQIKVDGNADSLDDLIDEINVTVGVPNVTAGTGVEGELTLTAAPGYEISFSDDTSGALAALGINSFFTGRNGADIDVSQVIIDDPRRINAGAGHVAGSNENALTLAGLDSVPIDELNGATLGEFWQSTTSSLAVQGSGARAALDAAGIVREGLATQAQAVSGVSLDEESINLLLFQRQFQAAARFITTIDEALQTLLSIA